MFYFIRTYLDPHFKEFNFMGKKRENKLKDIKNFIIEHHQNLITQQDFEDKNFIENNEYSIFYQFNNSGNKKIKYVPIIEELEIYENFSDSFFNFNILNFWVLNKNKFKILYQLSLQILIVQSSSAESERAFSLTVNIITAKINRLKPELVNALMIINYFINNN